MKRLIVSLVGEKVLCMEIFDDMVTELRNGETFVANYDSDLQIKVNYESLTIEDEEIEIVLMESDILDLIRVFLEARQVAREEPMNINYDKLLSGFSEEN